MNLQHTSNLADVSRYRRIAVVGVSGSGKTTLAKQLAHRLALHHVELDSLYWEPGWARAAAPTFRQRAIKAFEHERWVVDGNHPEVRDIIWSRVDTVVWLDYWLGIVMWRLLRRTHERCKTNIELWNGNRERSMLAHFTTKDSIFLWSLRTYKLRRREYTTMFSSPEYAHIKPIHLRSPRATQAWFKSLPSFSLTNAYTSVPTSAAHITDAV